MTSYKIAIPSYKRASTLLSKTLNYLYSTNVSKKCITVFVADKKELKDYKDAGVDCKIVVGVPTLRGQRKFIRNSYPKGANVFSIDDDISGIYQATTIRHKDLKLVTDLDSLLKTSFALCSKFKISLWGVGAVKNPFFMYGKGVSFDLKYICGGAYGEVINKEGFLDVVLEDKEDFERTIRHYIASGRVMRFNEYALDTKGYIGQGGMQETRTAERVRVSAEWLLNNFPGYCKLNTSKKNKKFVEVKLVDLTKNK